MPPGEVMHNGLSGSSPGSAFFMDSDTCFQDRYRTGRWPLWTRTPVSSLLPLDHLLSVSKTLSCSEHQVFSHQGLQYYQATSLLPRAGHSLPDVGSSKREGQLEGNFKNDHMATTTGFKVLNSKPNLKAGFVPQSGGQVPVGTGPGLFWAGVGLRVPVTVPPFQGDEMRFGEPGYDSGIKTEVQ